MTEHSGGDAAQTRAIAEQVADAAYAKFAQNHPEVRRGTVVAEIPPPLKWAAVVASAILTVSASAGLIWMVTSVSAMSVTLARMDERMGGYIAAQESRMVQIERRTERLESYHNEGSGR